MRFGPYDDLEAERKDLLNWLFDLTFGRAKASAKFIARQIHHFGTLNFLLRKR